MRLADNLALTYCLNVHPGETWAEQFAAIREHAEPIARRVAGDRPFGLGLRLSARSAAELAGSPSTLAQLREDLAERGLYALTVNAFPYGAFHGTPVKDGVYRPDWTRSERLAYTLDAARVLAALLPEGVSGCLSTAPLSFKGWPDWQRNIAEALEVFAEAGQALARLEDSTGRRLILAMEPEPFCYPETTAELRDLFGRLPEPVRRLGTLGCCFDTAHHAVAFENLADSLDRLRSDAIPIGKIQLSAAMAAETTAAARDALRPFADPVYLHQTCTRSAEGELRPTQDLQPALADDSLWQPGGEIRVHYHVPLFVEQFGTLRTTTHLLAADAFVKRLRSGIAPTLEIETYTWPVWQQATGDAETLNQGIVREFQWVRKVLAIGVSRTRD